MLKWRIFFTNKLPNERIYISCIYRLWVMRYITWHLSGGIYVYNNIFSKIVVKNEDSDCAKGAHVDIRCAWYMAGYGDRRRDEMAIVRNWTLNVVFPCCKVNAIYSYISDHRHDAIVHKYRYIIFYYTFAYFRCLTTDIIASKVLRISLQWHTITQCLFAEADTVREKQEEEKKFTAHRWKQLKQIVKTDREWTQKKEGKLNQNIKRNNGQHKWKRGYTHFEKCNKT